MTLEESWRRIPDALLYNAEFVIEDSSNTNNEADALKKVRLPFWDALLVYCSRIFASQYTRGNKEYPLKLDTISVESLHDLLNMLHAGLSQGNPPFQMTDSNVLGIYEAALTLRCDNASKKCVQFWLSSLKHENCVDFLLDIALPKDIPEVTEQCKTLFIRYFEEVISTSHRYVDIPMLLLRECLASDYLNVWSETKVFETILKWVQHSPKERSQYLPCLLETVRFLYCGLEYIRNKVMSNPFVLEDGKCTRILNTIGDLLHHLERRPTTFMDLSIYMMRPRISRTSLFAIGGWSNGQASNLVEVFDSRSKRWLPLPQDSDVQPRAYHGLVAYGSKIFMIGGFDGTNCFNDVRCYDSIELRWSEKAPMHRERCYISTAILGDFIYVMGGYDGALRTNTAEKYDIKNNCWHYIARMNCIRSDACAATVNGRIYIVGGFTGDGVLSSVEYYDPATDVWTPVKPMTTPRSGVRCVNYNNRLFVLGGYNGRERLNSVERYDARRDMWEVTASMPTVRSNFGACTFEGRIYAIGGFNGQTTIAQVDVYDGEGTWKTIQAMTINRSALGAIICDTADPMYYSIHVQANNADTQNLTRNLAMVLGGPNTRRPPTVTSAPPTSSAPATTTVATTTNSVSTNTSSVRRNRNNA